MSWGFFDPLPKGAHEYINLRSAIASQIQGIRGFTESDGFHGDGFDWYEFTLSADLADKLRTAVSRLDHVKIVTELDLPLIESVPDWWPRHWPADVKIYHRYSDCLILPDTGTKAWYLGVRM
jgi:hypothetical protein